MTTPKTVDALQEKWTARLGTRVAVHKEERVHQGNSFRYGLYVHSVNTAADMVWPDVWHPAWERGGGAALASLDAALEAKYPEPEPEPKSEPVNEPFRPYFSGAIQRGGQYNIAVRYSQYGEVVTYSIEDILAALDTHEAVKAWEAAARKADTEPFWYACRKGGIATRQYDTILAALIAEFGGEAALEAKS